MKALRRASRNFWRPDDDAARAARPLRPPSVEARAVKIDKTNPRHWLCLVFFAVNVAGAMLLRAFLYRRGARRRVVLYGHKLSGNLLAIERYWRACANDAFEIIFLTMDKAYYRRLSCDGIASVLATRPAAIGLLARADVVISDHGLHALALMVGRSSLAFVDVWHGIPFKGFDAHDFRLQHRYDEIWVASPLLARMYVQRFGFNAAKVKVTGYARTDRLLYAEENPHATRQQLGLEGEGIGRIILFAPTWKQDAAGRSMYPFGLDADHFLAPLSSLAERTQSTVIVRAHLNSKQGGHTGYTRIKWMPFADYPDTQAMLLASDVLVCDWSSIAFDWLLLDRPTVFLDVPAPFAKGFSLGPDYRYGALVKSLPALLETLAQAVQHPSDFQRDYRVRQRLIRDRVYDGMADGHATQRCMQRLRDYM
jgi:CDP-glycerol glycerophosphotransferase